MAVSVLTVRSASTATPLGAAVRVISGTEFDLRSPRLVILIHGFQNSSGAAHNSFKAMIKALSTTTWPLEVSTVGHFCEFHWPGDHANKAVSMASYSARVGDARGAGERLARWLASRPQGQEVCFIAHSLGCRVALEAVREFGQLAAASGPRITHLFLLAAAVPAPLCDRGEQLERDPMGSTQFVFCSTRDKALSRAAFGTGEYLYGELGEAVGRRGMPMYRWDNYIDTNLNHGDYWESYVVSHKVGETLGKAPERIVTQRSIDEWDLTSLWDEVDSREIVEHQLWSPMDSAPTERPSADLPALPSQ
jgi:predicted alpha/beta hydrolase family esterase